MKLKVKEVKKFLRILYNDEVEDLLDKVFKNSSFKGKANLHAFIINRVETRIYGTINYYGSTFSINMEIDEDDNELKINFAGFKVKYYATRDKFYNIYHNLRAGKVMYFEPEDFKEIENRNFVATCYSLRELLSNIFKKVELRCNDDKENNKEPKKDEKYYEEIIEDAKDLEDEKVLHEELLEEENEDPVDDSLFNERYDQLLEGYDFE